MLEENFQWDTDTVALFSATEAEFRLGSRVPVCYRVAYPTERISNFYLILKVFLEPLNGWGHCKTYFLLQCFVNLKLHIIKWCCFRTVQEDGVRPMGSREENDQVSAGHLILLIHTLYSWWPAPVVKLIYIYLLICLFLFECWRSKSSASWAWSIHMWAYGGPTCAKKACSWAPFSGLPLAILFGPSHEGLPCS